jgi:small GTP-binding protein
MQIDCVVKVMLVGDMGVGKSSLLLRLVENEFSPAFLPTIGIDIRSTIISVGPKRVKLQLYDSSGQPRYHAVTYVFYRAAHCIILSYDVSNRESFLGLRRWIQDIQNYARRPLVILVGNKSDLARQVSAEEAQAFADERRFAFFECNAKCSKADVMPIFQEIALDGISRLGEEPQSNVTQLELPAAPKHRRCCC